MYRVGGIAALVLGVAYLITMALYAPVGAPPLGGEAWLTYAAGKTSVWWAIVGLAVLTDLLFVPVAFSLYLVLRGVHRGAMLLATALVLLFVVLDVAVTQTNFAALITLSGNYDAATTEAVRAANLAAATYATAVLASTVGVNSIVVLALGEVLVGLVMLRASFSRAAAYLALVAGILGIVSVAGPLLVGALSGAVIISSVLTTAWVFLVGYRLLGLGRR
jgi:hypothetical protein